MEETLAGQVRSYERRRALYERSREFDERIEWTVLIRICRIFEICRMGETPAGQVRSYER